MFELTSKVIEGVVFANTPSYLYQRIAEYVRANSFSALSTDGLLGVLRTIDGKSAHSAAEGYVALVVLLQRGMAFEDIQKAADLRALPWARHIAQLQSQLSRSVSNDLPLRMAPGGITRIAPLTGQLGAIPNAASPSPPVRITSSSSGSATFKPGT